jgi:hypothetical protein
MVPFGSLMGRCSCGHPQDRNERENTMSKRTAVLTAGLLLAVTACTDSNGSSGTAGSPAPSAPATTGTTGGPPPKCVVGQWNASGVEARGSSGNVSGSITGGKGTTMTVDADGGTKIDFTGSQPLDFTAQLAGRTIRGQAAYNGAVRGTVLFGSQDSAGKGTWTPSGQVIWDDLKATVKLTEPISVTLLDNARISDFTGDKSTQAGGAVDVQPVLRAGSYTCAGNTLLVRTEKNGPEMEWTFTRA